MSAPRSRQGVTVIALLGVVAFMIGLTAASVPLYRLFCQATGYGGATQRAAAAPDKQLADRLITVRFDAERAPDLDWEFRPLQPSVTVHPGEQAVISYRAVNRAKIAMTGTATYNVTPLKAGQYFDKVQCFCFTKQHLEPGESADLSVSFFVDPDIARDRDTQDIATITLSYTMFRATAPEPPVRSTALTPGATVN
jgi:cytochrome c oxidase assembly protein subunit 11